VIRPEHGQLGGFLFGSVNERIGDLHSLRIGKGIIGRNHVSEMLVLQTSGYPCATSARESLITIDQPGDFHRNGEAGNVLSPDRGWSETTE
jgi:hypothetical protein